MPGIWNINSSYDVNTRKVSRQLSFDIGQIFVARVEELEKMTGEAILKLLDGWKFSAKLGGDLKQLPEGILKFQVEGFVDGKLQLKLLQGEKENKEQQGSIDGLLKEKNLDLSKEDYPLLDKMIKHNIPLTKENISNVKTIADFVSKMNNNPNEAETFIGKYLENKNIPADSPKGESIKSSLKNFFNELKNMTEEDVLTFFENDIEITEDNIKSFNNIFKESNGLFKGIKNLENEIKQAVVENKDKASENNIQDKVIKDNQKSENKIQDKVIKDNQRSENNTQDKVIKGNQTVETEANEGEVLLKSVSQLEKEDTENTQIKLQASEQGKNTENVVEKHTKMTKSELDLNQNNVKELAKNVKEQINIRTEDIKNIIKTALESKGELKTDVYNNVLQSLDKNINDFKVFNSVSNQYYYLDVPLNVDNSEYQCKLMIKDERKKGKKIDSTNVKIAASVNTVNMGVVDAYIKVNNTNMDVDIKCDELWIKSLNKSKDELLSSLEELNYNIFFKIDKKEKEMNIVNCREFFEDSSLGVINTKV